MGSSSPPPAPTTYIPEPQAPTVFQSFVPEEDFTRAADYINQLKTEREKTKAERYAEVGTPEEIGQRMKERNAKTESAYLSSLPNSLSNDAVKKIMAQIVNRRADEAGLDRPDGTQPQPEPLPAATPAPSPESTTEPSPAPTPSPALAPKKESKDFLKKYVSWDGKDFNQYISSDYDTFEDEEGHKLTGGAYYEARQKARPLLNPLREAGMSEQDMQYYAKKAGIRNVNSRSDIAQILKTYEADRA
jgi:pyruvate/2-oxoglutarate dehydrogenase complex dihydrolipoamide acyltransferase (E2) component